MTKAELVAAVADRAGLSRSQAKGAVDAFLETVVGAVREGRTVRLVGFGNFVPVQRAAGMARNPKTGAAVARPASRTVKFRAGDALRGSLR